MQRGFKKWCEDQAMKFRQELGIGVSGCLPARQLADHISIDMVEPQCIPGVTTDTITHLLGSAAQSWSAVTITAEDCRIIVYNPTHSSARLESDIMHELAHFIRNHVPSSFHQLPGLPFPLREYRKLDEDEAQWLGGCLQIPRAALLLVLRNGVMQDSELAVHFNASIEMVRYRRNATGVDQQLKNAARYIRRSN